MLFWSFWLRSRWRGAAAAALVVVSLAALIWVFWSSPAARLRLLGDAGAPRTALAFVSGTTLPRSVDESAQPGSLNDPRASLLDLPVAADAGPLTVAEAQAAWSAAEREQHQRAVLESLNCARRGQHLPALTLDPELSQAASEAWLRLARERDFSLAQIPGSYVLRGMLPLDTLDQAAPSCADLHLDAAALAGLGPATRIGIAIFPPQAVWDLPSAVILAQ